MIQRNEKCLFGKKLNKFIDDWMRSEISVSVIGDEFIKRIIHKNFLDFLEIYEKISGKFGKFAKFEVTD